MPDTTPPPTGAEAFTELTSASTERSIIDTILDLDALLSADIRRPEKLARIALRPDLEADLDHVDALIDRAAQDLRAAAKVKAADAGLGEGGQAHGDPAGLLQRRRAIAAEMHENTFAVRLRAMPGEAWDSFEAEHKATILDRDADRGPMLDALVVACAIAPKIDAKQMAKLRQGLSPVALAELRNTAWLVNNQSGVDVPKSSSSFGALSLAQPARS